MAERTVTYIVTTRVTFADEVGWKTTVRAIRSQLKKVLNEYQNVKVLRIENADKEK